jgi:hypothetical protein
MISHRKIAIFLVLPTEDVDLNSFNPVKTCKKSGVDR